MPGKSDCRVKPGYLSRFEPANSNLTKMSGYNPSCNLKILQKIIRFEPEKTYRLTEPAKNVRFDPNLDHFTGID